MRSVASVVAITTVLAGLFAILTGRDKGRARIFEVTITAAVKQGFARWRQCRLQKVEGALTLPLIEIACRAWITLRTIVSQER